MVFCFISNNKIIIRKSDNMLIVKDFKDYEIIDASNGEKYERWGKYYLLATAQGALLDRHNKNFRSCNGT